MDTCHIFQILWVFFSLEESYLLLDTSQTMVTLLLSLLYPPPPTYRVTWSTLNHGHIKSLPWECWVETERFSLFHMSTGWPWSMDQETDLFAGKVESNRCEGRNWEETWRESPGGFQSLIPVLSWSPENLPSGDLRNSLLFKIYFWFLILEKGEGEMQRERERETLQADS